MNNIDVFASVESTRAWQELAKAPHWDTFLVRQTFPGTPHGDTKCIPLRGSSSFAQAYVVNAQRGWFLAAMQLPHTVALITKVMRDLPIKTIGNIMAVALLPGGTIKPHIDTGEYPDHFERFHIVLNSPTGNTYHCGDEKFQPKAGDCFYFNHRLTHWAENHSKKSRIHVIVDVTLKE